MSDHLQPDSETPRRIAESSDGRQGVTDVTFSSSSSKVSVAFFLRGRLAAGGARRLCAASSAARCCGDMVAAPVCDSVGICVPTSDEATTAGDPADG
eukprot:scaffold212267_cov28-Tisochrysis_lutea.AAC.3